MPAIEEAYRGRAAMLSALFGGRAGGKAGDPPMRPATAANLLATFRGMKGAEAELKS